MEIKNRKHKKNKDAKKVSFLEWYDAERKNAKALFLRVASLVIILAVCLYCSNESAIYRFRNAPSQYSENTYDNLKSIMEENVSDEGIDEKAIKPLVSDFDISPNEAGNTVLMCKIVDGFFNAEVSIELDDSYEVVKTSRNYSSINEYLDYFWLVFRIMQIVPGILAFFAIVLIWNIFLKLIAFCVKLFEKIRNKQKVKTPSEASSKESTKYIANPAPLTFEEREVPIGPAVALKQDAS